MKREFINLKLNKLVVRLIRKTLMERRLQKMAQGMLDQANFSIIQRQSRMEQEQKDMETLLSTFSESEVEDQESQNSLQDNNVVSKNNMRKTKDYSNA